MIKSEESNDSLGDRKMSFKLRKEKYNLRKKNIMQIVYFCQLNIAFYAKEIILLSFRLLWYGINNFKPILLELKYFMGIIIFLV